MGGMQPTGWILIRIRGGNGCPSQGIDGWEWQWSRRENKKQQLGFIGNGFHFSGRVAAVPGGDEFWAANQYVEL